MEIEVNVQTGEVKEVEQTLKKYDPAKLEEPVTVTALDRILADPVQLAKLKAALSK